MQEQRPPSCSQQAGRGRGSPHLLSQCNQADTHLLSLSRALSQTLLLLLPRCQPAQLPLSLGCGTACRLLHLEQASHFKDWYIGCSCWAAPLVARNCAVSLPMPELAPVLSAWCKSWRVCAAESMAKISTECIQSSRCIPGPSDPSHFPRSPASNSRAASRALHIARHQALPSMSRKTTLCPNPLAVRLCVACLVHLPATAGKVALAVEIKLREAK